MNRWIVFWQLALLLSVSGAGLLRGTPGSANPGVAASVTLDDTAAAPPPPPSQVTPTSMWIGSISGTGISRSGYDCTATFAIPAGQAAETLHCKVVFITPNGEVEIVLGEAASFRVSVSSAVSGIKKGGAKEAFRESLNKLIIFHIRLHR
ncbi:MAG: hypothetical protein ACI8ZW_002105 [Yoonia sp.]|jgi:hypothetical protein